MKERAPVPLPGALPGQRGGKWTIVDFAGYGHVGGQTSIRDHTMRVPFGTTPHARNIRKHEMLHATFSPDSVPTHPDAAPEFIQIAEDARIQILGRDLADLHWAPGGFDEDAQLQAIIKEAGRSIGEPGLPSARLDFIKLCVARFGTPDYARIMQMVYRVRKPALRTLWRQLDRLIEKCILGSRGGVSNIDFTVALAIALTRTFMPQPPPPPPEPARPSAQDSTNARPTATPAERQQQQQSAREAARKAPFGSAPKRNKERTRPELPLWGRMELERPPLTVPLRARLAAPQPRAATEGTIVRYPHRWAPDRAIFTARRRRVGGTVLIDCSGSMKLSPADIRRIVTEAPAAVVALYSGTFSPENMGIVRVVVERGRCAHDKWLGSPSMGQNCIDGPALRWLATQRAPRLWVSDGCVVGAGGDRSDAHHADVDQVCHAARIRRIEKPDLAGDILAHITHHANGTHTCT